MIERQQVDIKWPYNRGMNTKYTSMHKFNEDLPEGWHSRKVVVSYKRMYVHEVLVNWLFKVAQEKVWLDEMTVPPWP